MSDGDFQTSASPRDAWGAGPSVLAPSSSAEDHGADRDELRSGPIILRRSEGSSSAILAQQKTQSLEWPVPEEVARRWWPKPQYVKPCEGSFWTKFCNHEVK